MVDEVISTRIHNLILSDRKQLLERVEGEVIGENEFIQDPTGELKVRQERGDMFHRNQLRYQQRLALAKLKEESNVS